MNVRANTRTPAVMRLAFRDSRYGAGSGSQLGVGGERTADVSFGGTQRDAVDVIVYSASSMSDAHATLHAASRAQRETCW